MTQNNQNIPGMNLNKYSKKPEVPESPSKMQKEMDKTKKDLEKLKSFIVKKYPFIQSISVLPPQALKNFIEEEINEIEKIPKENSSLCCYSRKQIQKYS